MKHRFLFTACCALASLAAVTSCMRDDIAVDADFGAQRKISLTGEISQVYQTRVNDSGFCDGDAVGVYIVDYDGSTAGRLLDRGNRADNVKHTFDEAAYHWDSAYDIYWKDSRTHIDIYGYYPFGSPDNVSAYPFELQKDQSTSAANGKLGGYEASDFLWGKAENIAPTDQTIRLKFGHILSSVRVTLAEGTGFADGEWAAADKAVLVTNTTRTSTIDLATGKVTATGAPAATGTIPYAAGSDYRAIVIPQEVAAGTALLNITVAGSSYQFTKNETMVYTASKQHNFTITVNKRAAGNYEFVLSSESITVWENDTVSHDATAREYIVIDVAEPGTLDSCIVAAGKDVAKVQNLKVTGQINSRDFAVMRYRMDKLQSLNLQEVEIVSGESGVLSNDNDGWYDVSIDSELPNLAMQNKLSLLRVILPSKLVGIGVSSFHGCSNLTGSLIIPEGVTHIERGAFALCSSMTGTLSLPTTLERIDGNYSSGELGAFMNCGFTCELKLPNNLKYIGPYVFYHNEGLYGSLKLPDNLENIGEGAFEGCHFITGALEIPKGVTDIRGRAFAYCGFNGNLTLHDGIEVIGDEAFCGSPFRGELILPKNLVILNKGVFDGCDFSGELKIPSGTAVIGANAFANNWRLMGTLEIPIEVQSIGANAFAGCRSIEGVIFERGVETIAQTAFYMCTGIGSIVCKGTTPPYVVSNAFDGVPKDNFTVEVPEASIHLYQTAVGWSDFKRISAYRNLVVRPSMATAINTTVTRDLVLNADDEWVVESQPDWVTLSATSGKGKTELKLTFAQMPQGAANREGEVVFKLRDKEYRTRCTVTQYDYEYAEDEIITLQKATKGNGVNLVFLGDGYNAKDIHEGKQMADIKQAVEHYFNIEPYKTYRDYFNVYTGIAVSPESGIGSVNTIIYNRFNTTAKGGVTLGGRNGESDDRMILQYACKAPTVSESNLDQTLIVMIPNTEDYGGITYMYADGCAIAYCPMSDYGYPFDFRGVIQHEAGGHGFGKLGDEYIYHNAFIDACDCTCCGHVMEFNIAKSRGWYENLSLTGKMNEVPWSHLIFHEKYSLFVDIFEGGYMHSRGVYRSEQNSCMNNDIPYYSTISREAIVKRIKAIAGEAYSFDDFVANDKVEVSAATRSLDIPNFVSKGAISQQEPVMMGKRPKL